MILTSHFEFNGFSNQCRRRIVTHLQPNRPGGLMKYSALGSTGLIVSRLAFGAMTFTAGNKDIGSIYKVGAKLADELVGRSLDAGINFFDTDTFHVFGRGYLNPECSIHIPTHAFAPHTRGRS